MHPDDESLRGDGGFDDAYTGAPPWDIDRPQREVVRLADADEIGARVLDVGCGTGENALFLAERGHRVWGVDASPRAIERARENARARNLDVTFRVHDALDLASLDRCFETAVDSGLFHVFDDEDRTRFVEALRAVLPPGGRYHVLCFSDREPGTWGPRRISRGEIEAAFADGWSVESIDPVRFELTTDRGWVHAWRATIRRE